MIPSLEFLFWMGGISLRDSLWKDIGNPIIDPRTGEILYDVVTALDEIRLKL